MKKYLIIMGMTAVMFAACSSNDELLTQKVAGEEAVDEENVTREDLMGNIPIEFADITGSAILEETRGSANINGSFSSGTMGIYCIAASKINAAEDPHMSGSTTALGKILNNPFNSYIFTGGIGQIINKGFIEVDQDIHLSFIVIGLCKDTTNDILLDNQVESLFPNMRLHRIPA